MKKKVYNTVTTKVEVNKLRQTSIQEKVRKITNKHKDIDT